MTPDSAEQYAPRSPEQHAAQVTRSPEHHPHGEPVRRPRATLWAFRLVLVLHAGLVAAQPILAGYYLSGEADAMDAHSPIGGSLWMLSLIQLVIALLYWRPGGGRLWPAVVTLLLFFAEFLQLIFGYAQNFAIHVPLGTAIVVGVVTLTIWSFRPNARRGRKEAKQ